MQQSNDYWLTSAEINSGIQVIKEKTLRFLNDAEILVNGRGNASHAVGIYIYAVEEFGKLLLIQDALKTINVQGRFPVDMSIFGRGSDMNKRRQAHDTKVDRALQTLPNVCTNRVNSVITTKNPATTSITIQSGTRNMPDVGTVSVGAGPTGIFTDAQAPSFPFKAMERMKGFYVDWDDNNREWVSDVKTIQGAEVQAAVNPSELLQMITEFRKFLNSYC